MAAAYSVQTCRNLAEAFEQANVHRPRRIDRYDPGDELSYQVTGVAPAARATVALTVDRFVGGGFAGQVYRVSVRSIDGEPIAGLAVGGTYAMKILIPPSAGAVKFRNLIYWLGFQSPFALQVFPAAARAGALWQKFIRRAAGIEFGGERAVVDILGTFADRRLGSCGELSEWIEGRTWRFEVDDNLAARKRWRPGDPIDSPGLGAPEYHAKKTFMARMVALFHRVGAPELARQYEWWSCKSQPNVLKRLDSDDDPAAGLTAVDFRAGLALLPWLPMSPGDFKLIAAGVFKRGSLVQFDRGNVATLQGYIEAHPEAFADMGDALAELKHAEKTYRDSQIDVAGHHVRLLVSPRLWGSIFSAAVQSWRTRNLADAGAAERLIRSKMLIALFALLGLLAGLGTAALGAGLLAGVPLAAAAMVRLRGEWIGAAALAAVTCVIGGAAVGGIARMLQDHRRRAQRERPSKWVTALLAVLAKAGPIAAVVGTVGIIPLAVAALCHSQGGWIGRVGLAAVAGGAGGVVLRGIARGLRTLWGRADLRRHYVSTFTHGAYFRRACRARVIERVIHWHRVGRISAHRAETLVRFPVAFTAHAVLSVLPARLHRFATDGRFVRAKLQRLLIRPLRLYFRAEAREQWLHEMVDDGLAHGMLSGDEAEHIRRRVKEPFIQTYLKSLAVHVCTLPITQVVSLAVAGWYMLARGLTFSQAWPGALAILVAFQVTPISPGSIVRGVYVVALAIRKRNYRDYKIALWMGFWKYIGYLSFPLQMAYRYPTLARFMAGRWATGAVHVLPVFGERGALAEHAAFDLFYNRPLTIRRHLALQAERRAGRKARRWHLPFCAAAAWVLVAQLPAWVGLWRGGTFTSAANTWPLVLAGLFGGAANIWPLALAALLAGAACSRLAGGAASGSRILMGFVVGLMMAGLNIAAAATAMTAASFSLFWAAVHGALLPSFLAVLLALLAAAAVELLGPERQAP